MGSRQEKRKVERTFDEEKKKKVKAVEDLLFKAYEVAVFMEYIKLVKKNKRKSPIDLHKQAQETIQAGYQTYVKADYKLFFVPRKFKTLKILHNLFLE